MSIAEAFSQLPDHDRVLDQADDDVMSLSNDLFKSTSFADLHAFAGSLFGDVSEPTLRGSCCGNDGLNSFGHPFLGPLVPVEQVQQQPISAVSFGTSAAQAPPAPPQPVALASSMHQPVSIPSPQLPPQLPPQQPMLCSGPCATAVPPSLPSIPGYVTILDSQGNAILVDHASARALAGTTITVSPVPGSGMGTASISNAVDPAQCGSAPAAAAAAATVSVSDVCHGKVASNCDDSVQPSAGAQDQAQRVKELASELNALLSDDQKRQLNALHLQARQAFTPDEAAAASAAFWDLWYRFADVDKVTELKELMGRLPSHATEPGNSSPQHQQQTSPMLAPASQDSNHSSSGAHRNSRKRSPDAALNAVSDDEDLQDCAAGAPRAPKSPRLQPQHELQAAMQPLATTAAPEHQPRQQLSGGGIDAVVRALQAYGVEQAGRLASLEATVKVLERMHASEAAARASAEQEAARLAGEVDRLRALLRSNA